MAIRTYSLMARMLVTIAMNAAMTRIKVGTFVSCRDRSNPFKSGMM
jgi:hypothetical protein